jgi:hypothetical protein
MRNPAGAALAAVCCVLCAAAGLSAQQPPAGFPAKLRDAPATLPDGCSAAILSELNRAAGTPIYRGVHREMAALGLGHEASQKLELALGQHGAAGTSVMHEMIQTMTGLNDAENMYLCASFVIGQGPDSEMERTQREAFVSIYNRMALETWRLENTLTMHAAAGAKGDAARSADSAAAILEDRRKTDTDLVETVTRGETHLIDGGSLRMTCSDRARLVSESASLHHGAGSDEFTSAAGLLEDFLKSPYSCMRVP